MDATDGIGIGAGKVNSALCSTSTLLRANQDKYAFADSAYLSWQRQVWPVGGVLIAFSAVVGARAFHGEVMPRAAEAAYEGAIAEGNSAFRVQEVGGQDLQRNWHLYWPARRSK